MNDTVPGSMWRRRSVLGALGAAPVAVGAVLAAPGTTLGTALTAAEPSGGDRIPPDTRPGGAYDRNVERVRRWRWELLAAGVGPASVAKAYRLLRAIMTTAVDDERVRRNPCRIKGADRDNSPERPVASVEQVYAVADKIVPWARGLVLLAAFTGLRWGELIRLRRHDVDLVGGFVRISASTPEVGGVLLADETTKSEAGKRLVGIPAAIVPDLRRTWIGGRSRVPPAGCSSVLVAAARCARTTTVTGMTPSRRLGWPDSGCIFHDLRHTANGFAAREANVKELMARMGHASARAALIYQHVDPEREREIAQALSKRLTPSDRCAIWHASGTWPRPTPATRDECPSGR